MGGALTAAARSLLGAPAPEVAPALLGWQLVAESDEGRVAVRLSEVEAYDGEADPGSHAYRGRTPRNAVMFGPAGHAYVYFTYGMHWCLNVSCGPTGVASAVLLRAGEVVAGVELARARRPAARRDAELASGPARLAVALGVDGRAGGVDLLAPGSPLRLVPAPPREHHGLASGPRVGVGGAGASTPWRFWVTGDPTVSVYRAHVPRRRAGPPRTG